MSILQQYNFITTEKTDIRFTKIGNGYTIELQGTKPDTRFGGLTNNWVTHFVTTHDQLLEILKEIETYPNEDDVNPDDFEL